MNNWRKLGTCILLISIISLGSNQQATQAFVPQEENIYLTLLTSRDRNLAVGTNLNASVVISNFSNSSITNVTIFLPLNQRIQLINSPIGPYVEDTYYNGSTDNPQIFDRVSKSNVPLSYLNVTSANFSLNFAGLSAYQSLMFDFRINMTETGTAEIIEDEVTMIYNDKWGDLIRITASNGLSFQVFEPDINNKIGFFPDVKIENMESLTLVAIMGAIVLVALFGRVTYFKKPIE